MTIVGYLASNAANNTAEPIGVSPQNPLPVTITNAGGTPSFAITSYDASGYVMNGLAAEPVLSLPFNIAASQIDSVLVAAVAGQSVRVLGVVCQAGATATTLVFNTKGSGAGTAISMIFQNNNNTGAVLPFNPHGWFQTTVGQGLTCTTGAGSTTGIQLIYAQY